MQKFPTIKKLSEANLSDVIKTWEGLGYYSRARNLHAGSIQIMQEFGGVFPDDYDKLLKIKGIGPYTAGAILSFAYHKKQPAVDGNVIRVIARHDALKEDVSKQSAQKIIWNRVLSLLPDKDPHLVMEALIELGATNCFTSASCFSCPLNQSCKAFIKDEVQNYPHKSKRPKPTLLHRVVWVLEHEKHLLVKKEADNQKIMAGLIEFPYDETSPENPTSELFSSTLKNNARLISKHPVQKHTFTRYKAFLYPHHYQLKERVEIKDHFWMSVGDLKHQAFSSGHKKIFQGLLASYS